MEAQETAIEEVYNGTQELIETVEGLSIISTTAYKYLMMICDLHRLSPCEVYVFLDCCNVSTKGEYSDISIKKALKNLLDRKLITKPSLGVYVVNSYLWNDKLRQAEEISLTVTSNNLLINCNEL
tara:strand:- start:7942 stop:8316 length:375 start_codon:yes stop_codon:yes gene_type:complete